jgi:hydrogenase maturation protein HypF
VGLWPFVPRRARRDALRGTGAQRRLGRRDQGRGEQWRLRAAAERERLAGSAAAKPYPCAVTSGAIVEANLVRAAHDDLAAGRPPAELAPFHTGVVLAAARVCQAGPEPRLVVLSGGSPKNLGLLAGTRETLLERGFRVLSHRLVPPADGGLSYHQAAVAAGRISSCA